MNENGCRALGKLYVHGMGHFHPQNVIDNSFPEILISAPLRSGFQNILA